MTEGIRVLVRFCFLLIILSFFYHLPIGAGSNHHLMSEWTQDMDLSFCDTTLTGERDNRSAGVQVSEAGDINRDGFDDFLILSSPVIGQYASESKVHLVFGSDRVWNKCGSLKQVSTSFSGYYISNYDFSTIGDQARGVGDINGDCFDDIIIENRYTYGSPEPETEKRFLVYFGRNSGWDCPISTSEADASFYLGKTTSVGQEPKIIGAGDLNGDGIDDIAISTPRGFGYESGGVVYVFFGKGNGWTTDIPISSSDASITGLEFDQGGCYVAGCGDLNGDGFDDILIGSRYNDTGGTDAGFIAVIFGKASDWMKDTPISSADTIYWGERPGDNLGSSVSGAGDVNGDGFDDILVGASHDGPDGRYRGKAYLVFGKSSGWATRTNITDADSSFIGESVGCGFGSSLSSAGDINGDGLFDLLLGGGDTEDQVGRGKTYLLMGMTGGWGTDLPIGLSDASFVGEEEGDHAGCSVTGAGDVDGDGFDEILIGAYGNDEAGDGAGKVYLLFHTRSNRAPEIITKDVLSAVEDQPYGVRYEAVDDDRIDDVVTWSVKTDCEWLSIDPVSGWLNGTPTNEDVGCFKVILTAQDTLGGLDSSDFVLEVVNMNDPPEVLPPDIPPIIEGKHFEFTMKAFDVDSRPEDMVWTLESFSTFMVMDPASGNLSGRPENEDVGLHTIIVKVEDGSGGIGTLKFNLSVQNWNNPPFILTIPVTSAKEDEQYSQYFECRDIDDDDSEMRYQLNTNARFLSLKGRASIITGTPVNQDVGIWWINFSVHDDEDGLCWSNYTLTVMNVNDPPFWADAVQDLQIKLGNRLYHSFTAMDWDTGDVITYSLKDGHGTNASIDGGTGALDWRPDTIGRFNFTIVATDGDVSIKHSFEVLVWKFNGQPVVAPIGDRIVAVGGRSIITVNSYDPDEDALFYSITSHPQGMVISNSGTIDWTPGKDQVGSYLVTVEVKDGISDPVRVSFNITVTIEEVNAGDGPQMFLVIMIIVMVIAIIAVLLVFLYIRAAKKRMGPPGKGKISFKKYTSERIEGPADHDEVPYLKEQPKDYEGHGPPEYR